MAKRVEAAGPAPDDQEASASSDVPGGQAGGAGCIVWKNVLLMGALHLAALYGAALFLTTWLCPLSSLTFWFYYFSSGWGTTAGAHRLWAHRSYKAKLPLRIYLALAQTIAGQNDIYEWSRDHRTHHKFSETDADPHNSHRGFFFSHVGWLLMRKHPSVIKKGATIDMSDLLDDPVVVFQKRYYKPLVIFICFLFTIFVPPLCWGESFRISIFVLTLFRYCLTLNLTWLVNSAAHKWGNKPYEAAIDPAENMFVVFAAVGEGFHNYHHAFPQDYSTSEFMGYNLTTKFINLMAALGQVTDRKKTNPDLIEKRKQRTGDGTSAWNN